MKKLWMATLAVAFACAAVAQPTASITGTVKNIKSGETLPGATLRLLSLNKASLSDTSGHFQFSALSPGAYKLQVSYVGFEPLDTAFQLSANQNLKLLLALTPSAQEMQGITVTALRPDMEPRSSAQNQQLREMNARDEGEVMRNLQGVDAVRRGPLGLDPSIRGLRETEVGFYVDGSRMFPAGPARMDSPLSHYDPSDIQSIEVVKGPYALMWGPGNLSAVRVTTRNVPNNPNFGLFHGDISGGYSTNIQSPEASVSLFGRKKKFGYRLQGNWREGNNYTSGDGTEIPAGFHSRGLRGKVSYQLKKNTSLSVDGGWQKQNDIDYPGRLLNAHYFHTYDLAAHYRENRPGKLLSKVAVDAYFNRIDHQMNNDGKPTALADTNRMPPFPLLVVLTAQSRVFGGNARFTFTPSTDWTWVVGGNFYSNYRYAERNVSRRDNGMLIFQDLAWPGVTNSMGGVFARLQHPMGKKFTLTAIVREDMIAAKADSLTSFFSENVSTQTSSQHAVTSGAVTLAARASDNWTISLGLGSASRPGDASELYSDRFPSSKAQTSAEFVGNPSLLPETSLQADLWVEGHYSAFSIEADMFARKMQHYVTLMPTNLHKRLPLSPNTVYQYVNGEANFYGFEVTSGIRMATKLNLGIGLSYLYGQNITQNEPALGVSPFSTDVTLRYGNYDHGWFGELLMHTAASQKRVASSLGENPTAGYYTLGIKAGWKARKHFSINAGVENLTDQQYVNHLNSKNPFTMLPIPEPGRIIYGKVSYNF